MATMTHTERLAAARLDQARRDLATAEANLKQAEWEASPEGILWAGILQEHKGDFLAALFDPRNPMI